ncbi:MAG: DUF72 domain-containing protein, partial [Verrucomicrobiota bacterium]
LGYHLGGHGWAVKEWVGSFLPPGTPASALLSAYSRQVNTVEGNSTFYGLPEKNLVHRWMDQAADGFRFCFKFPRSVSHDHQLQSCRRETDAFLEILSIAETARHLGPAFLQLGPHFDGSCFHLLETFLENLPKTFRYAVEVRHLDYFDGGPNEHRLNQLLSTYQMERMVFDTRALYAQPPSDASETRAQSKKPKMPLCQTAIGTNPMVRLVGRNRMQDNKLWMQDWVPQITGWIQAGKAPYVFIHTPDDQFFPEQAHAFHEALREKCPQLPKLPFEPIPQVSPQMDLF